MVIVQNSLLPLAWCSGCRTGSCCVVHSGLQLTLGLVSRLTASLCPQVPASVSKGQLGEACCDSYREVNAGLTTEF